MFFVTIQPEGSAAVAGALPKTGAALRVPNSAAGAAEMTSTSPESRWPWISD